MASRVTYGMAREGLIPSWFGKVGEQRRTPGRAIALVTLLIVILALGFPLVHLAQATSIVILVVFTSVNLSLWIIGSSLRQRSQVGRINDNTTKKDVVYT
ncbi:hypothetical protein BOV94_08590 [Solemya velum gill symbiont]|nr:hypothetical protein BOV94_08590 [Solemya velum gill symbiont]